MNIGYASLTDMQTWAAQVMSRECDLRGMIHSVADPRDLELESEAYRLPKPEDRLDSRAIWVKPGALALSIDNDQAAFRLDAVNAGEII